MSVPPWLLAKHAATPYLEDKKILSTHFGKGKVRVRGHGADWAVKIDTAPTSVEHRRELETKVRELIDRSNIGLGRGYSIDI
jgi:hypothetical protein